MTTEHLAWGGCRNARDVGGLPAGSGRATRHGVLIRSESLHHLDPDGVRAVTDHGVGTIIDLRSDWELGDQAHPFAAAGHYRRIPWIDPERDAERDPAAEQTLADLYRGSLDRNTRQVAAIVQAVARADETPVVVHCHSGKDRTGLLVALLLDLVGVPRNRIAADYAASERHLGLLDGTAGHQDRADEFWRTRPESILAALAHLEQRYGGSRRYLLGCGVPPDVLDRLIDRLVTD